MQIEISIFFAFEYYQEFKILRMYYFFNILTQDYVVNELFSPFYVYLLYDHRFYDQPHRRNSNFRFRSSEV